MFLGNSRITLGGGGGKEFLYAGGTFSSASNVNNTQEVAKWDEKRWSPLRRGLEGTVRALKFSARSTKNNPRLYVGGEFTHINGTQYNYIALWTGKSWSTITQNGQVGMNGPVYALETISSSSTTIKILMGGSFTAACGITASRVVSYDDYSLQFDPYYEPVNDSLSRIGSGLNGTVRAIAYGPLAKLDHASLEDPGNALSPNDNTYTLYFGGSFTAANDGTTGYGVIQRHFFSDPGRGFAWLQIDGFSTAPSPRPEIYALNCLKFGSYSDTDNDPPFPYTPLGTLLVGGTFTKMVSDDHPYGANQNDFRKTNISAYFGNEGGVTGSPQNEYKNTAQNRWNYEDQIEDLFGNFDNPTDGFNGPVHSIVARLGVFGVTGENLLYIGGEFTKVKKNGVEELVNYIVRYDLSTHEFSPLTGSNGTTGTNGPVYAIAIDSEDSVYVGGSFTGAGNALVNRIARWGLGDDGTTNWYPLDEGTNNTVFTIELNPDTYLGGGWGGGGGGGGAVGIIGDPGIIPGYGD